MTDKLAEIRRWVTEEAFLEERARQSFDWLLQRITDLEQECDRLDLGYSRRRVVALSAQLRTAREALQEVARETVMNSHDAGRVIRAEVLEIVEQALASLNAPTTEGIGTCTCHKSLYCPVHADAPAQPEQEKP